MPIRSHVDPVLYTRFLLLDEADLNPSDVALWREPPSSEALTPLVERLFERNRRLMFHEVYHCLQGLHAPFLRRFAIVAWANFQRAFDLLARSDTDHRNWRIDVHELACIAKRSQILSSLDGAERVPVGDPVSILEFIEGITSLVEWQLFANETSTDPVDGVAFNRWTKRFNGYYRMFDITASAVGPEYAMMCGTAIGNVCLFTNQPLRAFGDTLGILRKYLKHPRNRRVFREMSALDRTLLVKQLATEGLRFNAQKNTQDITDDRFFELSLPFENVPNDHPLFSHDFGGALSFQSTTDNTSAFMLLTHPERLPNAPLFFERMLLATSTIVRVKFVDGYTRTHGFFHPSYAKAALGSHQNSAKEAGLHALRWNSTMHSVIKRASLLFYDEAIRTCTLSQCPEWEANYCNSYIPPPADYTKCKFLFDLSQLRKGLRGDLK